MDIFETHQNCLRELFHLRDIKRLGLTWHDLSHVSKLIARERKARRTGGEYHSIVLYLEKFCPTLSTATLTVPTLVGASTLIYGKKLSTRFVTYTLYLLYFVLDWILTSRVSTLFELVNTLHTGTVTRRLVTVPSCRVLTRSNSVLTLRREYSISIKIQEV